MPYAEVRGQRLWYEDVGQGDAVLMLHGFTGTAQADLSRQIEWFSRSYRVIAPDLRGYGRSLPKPRQFPVDFYVQDALDAAALLEALGIERAHVLGYSDGGESAVLVGIERPERVRSIVAWGVAGQVAPELLAIAEDYADLAAWPSRRGQWLEQIEARHGPGAWEPMVSGWVAAMRGLAAAGGDISYRRAHEIRRPVLLMNGEHDRGNPIPLLYALASRIPHCQVEVWPGLGHPIHVEATEAFNRRVQRFLEEVALAERRSA